MKYSLYILFLITLTSSCSGKKEQKLLENIKTLEADKQLANSDTLINSYIRFADQYPGHPYAIKFLYKAAEASVKAGKNGAGARLYERLANNYKDSTTLASEALINAGFNYEALHDAANEKRVFEQFLNQYPDHPRAQDIRFSLELIGLSPELQDSILMSRIMKNNPDM